MPTVLFVGRLDRQKGIRELVHAFALLHSEVRGVKLLIAGEGGEASWITGRVRELQLEASVEQRGRVPHNEISRLIGECSLLCLPSDGEPFGMAIVEAMAGGRAVVAIDRGGPRHLVHRGGGILVPPGDERALADALRTLLVSPDRLRAMGTFNRRRVDREFALSRVLDAIELTYVEVIKELQPGSSPTRGSSG
jgi:glycosyltransferase involved in cell wall biosynthesis